MRPASKFNCQPGRACLVKYEAHVLGEPDLFQVLNRDRTALIVKVPRLVNGQWVAELTELDTAILDPGRWTVLWRIATPRPDNPIRYVEDFLWVFSPITPSDVRKLTNRRLLLTVHPDLVTPGEPVRLKVGTPLPYLPSLDVAILEDPHRVLYEEKDLECVGFKEFEFTWPDIDAPRLFYVVVRTKIDGITLESNPLPLAPKNRSWLPERESN